MLTCVDLRHLPEPFVGRPYDAVLLADLPPGVHPCGERGEFHTFCFAGRPAALRHQGRDRRHHMYIVGKTGMRKSTILRMLIASDLRADNGLALVDPHGDLAEEILRLVPDTRTFFVGE